MEMDKTNKLKQEIEEYLTKNYCCEFKEECIDGIRTRCSEYETNLYLILRFVEPKEKYIAELEKENAGLKARLNAINLLTPELEKSSKLKTQRLTKAKYTLKKIIETVQNDRIDEYGARLVLIKDFAYKCLEEIEK